MNIGLRIRRCLSLAYLLCVKLPIVVVCAMVAFVVETIRGDKGMAERELLQSVLEAWDSLKEGNYQLSEGNRWLADTMAPAMQDIRNFFMQEEIGRKRK